MEMRPSSFFAGLLCFGLLACSTASTGCAGMSDDATSVDMGQPGGAIARDVSISELKRILADRPDVLLLDVRTDKEWQDGHLPGAAFLDFLEDDFTAVALTLPRTQPIALYCAAGGRSEDAMKRLSKAGFTELYNLRGGFYDWEDAGEAVSMDPPVALPTEE